MAKPKPTRLAPTKDVLRALFARSGNCCAFPGCHHHLIDDDDDFVANVCHIEAAAPGGQRFNPNQTDEERRSYDNLVIFCYEHHIKTNNTSKFSVEKLKEMKRNHESKSHDYKISFEALNKVYNSGLNKIIEILERHTSDFRKHTAKFDQHQTNTEESFNTLLAEVREIRKSSRQELLKVEDLPEFDSMKQLREENKHEAVLVIIKNLKEKKWEKLSTDSQVKLLINEGLSYLDLGKYKSAAESFLTALPLRPETDETTSSYAAVAYHLTHRPDKAREYLEKTLAINPNNVNAFNILIQLQKNEPYQSIKEKIPKDLLEVPEISYNLALAAKGQGLFNEAIELLQNTVDNSKTENPIFLGTLGSTIIQSITSDPFPYVTDQIGSEVKTKVQYAIKVISKAWEIYDSSDLKKEHCDLLINRAIGKRILKDYAQSLEDIQKANSICPADPELTKHLMIAYIEVEQFGKALEISEQLITLTNGAERIEALTLKASILQSLKRHVESLDILLPLYTEEMPVLDRKHLQHFIVTAYTAIGKNAEANEFLENLIARQPDEISSYLESIIYYWNIGEKEKARTNLEKAYSLINDQSPPEDLFELARHFYSVKDYEKAAFIFEKITDTNSYSPVTKKLIQALFNSGEKKKALNICLNLEKLYGLDRFLTEGLVMIYESVDDIDNAIAACNKYLTINPDDQVIIIRLAFLYDRFEIRDKLSGTLKKIVAIDYTLQYEHLYRLANIYFKNGQNDKALKIAYETRRENYNTGNSHFRYFSLLSEFKSEKDSNNLPVVAIDSVVRLAGPNGHLLSYIIEDRKDTLAERGELNSKDPLAKLLLGKKIGDTITLEKNFVEKPVFEIKEIITKHLYAFQESINLFSTRFINEPGIVVMDSPIGATAKERFAPILRLLDAEEPVENKMNDHYRNGHASIGVISSIRRQNPIRTFYILSSDPTLGIRPVWHINELANAKKSIDSNSPIIVDIISLTTLSSTDALFLLERLPNKKIISPSTFDVVTDILSELRMSSQGMRTYGKINGQNFLQEVTAEQVATNISYYEKLINWIKTNCEIRPASEKLNMKDSKVDELTDLLGASFHDSILIGKELNAILLTDDNVLRQLAFTENQVRGIHSFLLSIYMLDKGLITREEHTDFTLELFSMNFKHLPCDFEILLAAVKRSKFQPDDLFSKVVLGLASPLIPERIATIIVVHFLYEIYSDSGIQIYSSLPLKTIRYNLAIPVLNALFTRPIHLKHLAQALSVKFHYLPEQMEELVVLIRDLLKG